ncbi:MAG: hypothetical protein NTU66_06510 [Elusimicrobia bacterium]|nr:hypothetical protein [Elusimicrobiota bacterium]
MKKIAVLVGLMMLCAGVSSFAAEATPVKVSLFPMVAVPASQTVHGLDLGLIATKVDEVQGVQLAWIYGATREKMVGLQTGFVAQSQNITGVQFGFINIATSVTGVQLGFVNYTQNMKGIQVGLVNIITKGYLPAMIFVNANF